ncbi:MAG: hypothetical protein WBE38_05005 [Terracidiphilus sp.]
MSAPTMPNITVTVSESAYRKARVWAAEHNTSVSAVVQYCIERLPRLPIAQKGAIATARRIKEPRPTGVATLAQALADHLAASPPPPPREK